MKAENHLPSSSFSSACRWLNEPAAQTIPVTSVVVAIEEAHEEGGVFLGGPFFTARGVGVLVLLPEGNVVEYLQPDPEHESNGHDSRADPRHRDGPDPDQRSAREWALEAMP